MPAKPRIDLALAPWQREMLRTVLGGAYYAWAGVELASLSPGAAQVTLHPTPAMITPWGQVNGGVVNSLLELPAFLALFSEMNEGEHAVTNDIFIQNMRPIAAGVEVVLEGRLLRRGRTMAWCESAALVDGRPHVLARITKTLLDRKRPQAARSEAQPSEVRKA